MVYASMPRLCIITLQFHLLLFLAGWQNCGVRVSDQYQAVAQPILSLSYKSASQTNSWMSGL
jgi:hypothetical protein